MSEAPEQRNVTGEHFGEQTMDSTFKTADSQLSQETNSKIEEKGKEEEEEEEDEEELEYESQDDEDFETCYVDNQEIDNHPPTLDSIDETNFTEDIINDEDIVDNFDRNEGELFIDSEREEKNTDESQKIVNHFDSEGETNEVEDFQHDNIALENNDVAPSGVAPKDYVNVFSDSDDEIKVTKEVITDVSNKVDEAIEINDYEDAKDGSNFVNLSDDEEIENVNDDYDDDFERGIDIVGKLSKLRVYVDFCDLTNSLDQLGSIELQRIKPNFDILKLFKIDPTVKEDDEYSELGCICQEFEECINLTFNELFGKLGKLLNVDLNKVVIYLSIPDLLNFTVSSDFKSSSDIHIRDVLQIYETMKSQSPNSDLYKFLTIKVWCTQNIKEQIRILQSSSKDGYHLGNLKQLNLKRKIEENDTIFQQSKRQV